MGANVLIIGQGLAGTLLAWELERAGLAFEIADEGHAKAASRVAAGIINPITGRRLVKSWRVDELRPVARATFRAMERELGVALWREMRVRRFFANEEERRVLEEKRARGELGDYAGAAEGDGFWIEGAARVDLAALVTAARARWRVAGVLREERVTWATVGGDHELVIDCTGARRDGEAFDFVPWRFSKGECLTVAKRGLAPDVVLNRRHWIVPLEGERAMVGATQEPGRCDWTVTRAAREELERSVALMSRGPFTVEGQEAGVRSYVSDKKPVAGRHPANMRWGVLNGLGAKGALWAPELARQWVRHLVEGAAFDPEVDVARWWSASDGTDGSSRENVIRR